jgi:hypothetical protein
MTHRRIAWGDDMQHILVYSDSAAWGIIPPTRRRLPFDARWPGVMELALLQEGRRVRRGAAVARSGIRSVSARRRFESVHR